ncbi:Protein of unknown function [Paenibacillus algorifonticola]|uniref:DUF4054 domain-containing protein n=1 Tax=Paenibacillus algorifonticola TaxID=684063 RepID=A0A1I2AL39_9BACL|nr:DUF4054 domain-containing protein [Paenibacillus algorifonticola]SFE43590.1 Protein of unknown function [Paenibacillus algorifonticola]
MNGDPYYGHMPQSVVNGLIAEAANVKIGTNPPYTLADFKGIYPQFDGIVPDPVIQMYIDLANACILQVRWKSAWKIAIGWFVAHFLTLYLQGAADPGSDAGQVMAVGQAKGLNTSEAVGDVSVSMDYGSIGQDLDGWAAWKLTIYGQQLATMGKLYGKGGMYVY